MIVRFPVFFISLDIFKTETGKFRTGRKVEIFTRLRAGYVVIKKKKLRCQCTPNDHHSLAPLYGQTFDAKPSKVYIF